MSINRSPWAFFLWVAILALPFWLIGPIVDPFVAHRIPINLPTSALWFLAPITAAMLLNYRDAGWAGAQALLKRSVDYRRIPHRIWYLPIFLLWPLMMIVEYGVMKLMGTPLPEPQIPIVLVPVFFGVFFVSAVCEEVGWTGYALDPLQDRRTALGASIILGVVWALGHLVPIMQTAHAPTWVAFQVLGNIPFRILIVWLYNNTGKSLFAAVAFHDMSNVCQFLYPNFGSHYDPLIAFAILSCAAALVVLVWGPETLARCRFARLRTSRATR